MGVPDLLEEESRGLNLKGQDQDLILEEGQEDLDHAPGEDRDRGTRDQGRDQYQEEDGQDLVHVPRRKSPDLVQESDGLDQKRKDQDQGQDPRKRKNQKSESCFNSFSPVPIYEMFNSKH